MVTFRNLELLKQFAKETNPRVTTRKGSPLHDLHLVPMAGLMQQYETDQEDAFGEGNGLDQFSILSDERMDTLASNLLGFRRTGETGSQVARMLIDELDDYTFGEGELVAEDESGNQWLNVNTVSITKAQLTQQRSSVFYYTDILFESEDANAGLGVIASLTDQSQFAGFVSITGDESTLNDGITKETNEELFLRTQDGVASNNLVVGKGIERILGDEFKSSLREIYPIGFGDPEMMRDIPRDENYVPVFNLHVGAHTDAYVKSQKVSSFELDVSALSIDTNREKERSQPIKMNGTVDVYLGRNPIISIVRIIDINNTEIPITDFDISESTGMISSLTGRTDTVLVFYRYNPISIDIRSVPREGREDFTIERLVFLRVASIEELDPVTGTPNGITLERNGGYGQGPYGRGPYGRGQEGDWSFHVEKPHQRFSMEDESYIEFASVHFGKDVKITYNAVPELSPIHDFAKSRGERTECGNTLVKNFIPIFVRGEFEVEVESGDDAPDLDAIKTRIESVIDSHSGSGELDLDDIIAGLFDLGVAGVTKCFILHGEIQHTDGSIQIISDDEKLSAPSPVLPKDTPRVISSRIARFYAGNITVIRVEV